MTRSLVRYGCAMTLLAVLVACDGAAPPPAAATASMAAASTDTASAPFKPTVTVKQLMDEVLEPAANVYWEAVGSVSDARGTREIAPKTDSQWIAVRNAATVVAEAGNLMMLDGRARNTDEWMAFSRALIDVSMKARVAAEQHDTKAVFDLGAEMYQACVNCHAIYYVGPKAIPSGTSLK